MKKSKTQSKQQRPKSLAENNISVKRNILFIVGFICLMAMNAGLIYRGNFNLDEQLIIYFTTIVLYGLSIYILLYERRNGVEIYRSTSYKRWFFFQILQFAITIFFVVTKSELPFFILNGFLLVPSQGCLASLITVVLDSYMIQKYSGADSNYLLYILIQGTLGICFAYLFKEKIRRREKNVSLVLTFFAINGILFTLKIYTKYHKVSLVSMVSMLIGVIIYTLLVDLIYPYIIKYLGSERLHVYRDIMNKNYSLRREIKDFSKFEYEHALKVSYFSGKAAFMIGADTLTSKAGGMYYRFPKLFDKEVSSEAMKILENHCFPKEVMDIVYEYGGELRKPTSPESAIVHMIDSVITRMELLDEDTMKSSWNQDMVIYSILNDLSGKGIYDESGLSLNQYLKIRDYLVNENLLINVEED